MSERPKIVIVGAGGFAREVAWLLDGQVARGAIELVGFADKADGPALGRVLNGHVCRELDHFAARFSDLAAVIAIASPRVRERLFAELDARGIGHFTCVDAAARHSGTVRIGAGSVVCCGAVLTVDIEVGRAVQLNPGCTVGHDTVIEDFVTVAPGAHIAGNVLIKKGARIGIGASIVNGVPGRKLTIGEYATVGAGACVIGDVPAGATVVGVPAAERRPRSA